MKKYYKIADPNFFTVCLFFEYVGVIVNPISILSHNMNGLAYLHRRACSKVLQVQEKE